MLTIIHARIVRPNLARTFVMQLHFSADRRTLFWAFILFPIAPLVGYTTPRAIFWLLPLTLYCSYCSGVLAHNHSHAPLFRERRWNALYSAWLSFFYGCPVFAWIPTHHASHHRYLNGAGDITRTNRHSPRNTLWQALSYPFRSAAWQFPAIRSYVQHTRERGGAALQDVVLQSSFLVAGHVALLGVSLFLHGARLGTLVYLVTLGLPAALAPTWMMFTNYIQHVDCDADSPDDHSRNFTNPLFNWLTFDNGYHAVHHERPGLHWSLTREAHLARAMRVDPRLNRDSPLSYCIEQYVRLPWQRERAARYDALQTRP
jgi:beta-carotene hydroxylase